jgi:aldose sugar dehydrogenase
MDANKRGVLVLVIVGFVGVAIAATLWFRVQTGYAPANETTTIETTKDLPKLNKQHILSDLSNVWDLAFLPDKTPIFTERAGTISKVEDGKKFELLKVPNVFAKGEGGLLGLAVDPEFDSNHFIYACYDTPNDIRVSRWMVSDDVASLSNQTDIITGMPVNTGLYPGRHSGCRPRFGADGYLWIGTGDVAQGTNPQDPKSLGGKILRVDRDGNPAQGNLGGGFDSRIYSYGHRNVQGLAMYKDLKHGILGYSVEHGPDKNDEVNPLKSGNMGWNPVPNYNELVSMTDKELYPTAIEPIWVSGAKTIAPSGMTFVTGRKWQKMEGMIAMAVLKGKQLRMLELDSSGKLKTEYVLFENEFGRIRSAVMGPEDDLYLTTDNGGGKDRIIRLYPN